jgi:hypothetical protein
MILNRAQKPTKPMKTIVRKCVLLCLLHFSVPQFVSAQTSPTQPAGLQSAANTNQAITSPMQSQSQMIDQAIEYYFPVYEMARTRYLMTRLTLNPARRDVNTLFHQRALANHRARAVTTPNTDTLYSSSWLDLKATPLRLIVPAIADRYWSIAFMDVFTNNYFMLGSRLGDGLAGKVSEVLLIGPEEDRSALPSLYQAKFGQAMPATLRVIQSPSNDVWMLGRWLVDSPEDTSAAHLIQDATRLEALRANSVYLQRQAPETEPSAEMFVGVVNEMMARNPVPLDESDLVNRWRAIGLDGSPDAWARMRVSTAPSELQELWQKRWPEKRKAFKQGLMSVQRKVQGWSLPDAQIGNYGKNYALRARVALGGLGALEPAEAVYLTAASDASGQPLQGDYRYRLVIPPGGIPAKAFWSMTMYELMPDGRLFFIANELDRFALGDRSPGIAKRADGSFDLWLSVNAPDTSEARAAWLPTPKADFRVTLRAYVPTEAMIRGEVTMPMIERLP